MNFFKSIRRIIVPAVFVFSLVMLSSCTAGKQTGTQQTISSQERQIQQTVNKLVRSFESEDSIGFIRQIHEDYDDGQRGRLQLRSELRDVFDLYQRIRLDTFGFRVTETDREQMVFARMNWNLSWTCSNTVTGPCNGLSENQVVRRSGRTTLGFLKDDGSWKLVDQSGQFVFGSLNPGSQLHP